MTGGVASGRPARRVIAHLDMDAFFASVEVLDDPSLAGVPLVVGGDGPRGVVASASYEARAYGVRSAMPSSTARRLCPQAVFRPGRHDRYGEVSAQMHQVLRRFTPWVEGLSLDEAFLDVTGATGLFGPPPEIAATLRAEVIADTGLGCSVGVASTKLVAKLASEAAKPRSGPDGVRPGPGVVVVEDGREAEWLRPMPVGALWGVGPATAGRLHSLGITTVGALAAAPPAALERALGRSAGRLLHELASGVDPRRVEPDRAARSIGHEETYATDRHDPAELRTEVMRLADAVGARLRSASLRARTVSLKVRFGDFATITKSRSARDGVGSAAAIAALALSALDDVRPDRGVRLLGVSVSGLAPALEATEQLSLDLEGAKRAAGEAVGGAAGRASGRGSGERAGREAADSAVDAIRRRFGAGAVGPAALVSGGALRVGPGGSAWGPNSGSPPAGAAGASGASGAAAGVAAGGSGRSA